MSSPAQARPMIRLEALSKRFAHQRRLAVDNLTLDIYAGEIVVFVGPSGCGKTTTMKMINRLIEPTSGEIYLEGDNVTHVNPNRLRRHIGYVIQQIGLFPHMSIADNIAVVPRMLGWDKARIGRRVDELLHMMGIPAHEYRHRYPKALSGGQSQRVGVARALAADPPVLLMDEPFGAIDPITRKHLQDEFLRIQGEVRKTIVFVTHDIDEAIKMGDRIAVLREGSHIAQYDTPEQILTHPADDFVRALIGGSATLKRLALSRVGEAVLQSVPTAREGADTEHADGLLLIDAQGHPQRWADDTDARAIVTVSADATLQEALDALLLAPRGRAVVVDAHGAYQGVVDFDTVAGYVRHSAASLAQGEAQTQ